MKKKSTTLTPAQVARSTGLRAKKEVYKKPRIVITKLNKNDDLEDNEEIEKLTIPETSADLLMEEAFRFFPEKANWRARLIYTLFEWAKLPRSYTMQAFCTMYGICRDALHVWGKTYPDVGKALARVKLQLADRKYIGCIEKELDRESAFKDMHRLDPEWHEIDKYHADLKKQETHAPTNITVEFDGIPMTKEVDAKIKLKEKANERRKS